MAALEEDKEPEEEQQREEQRGERGRLKKPSGGRKGKKQRCRPGTRRKN